MEMVNISDSTLQDLKQLLQDRGIDSTTLRITGSVG
jgi:hypothetical protein